MEPLARAQLSLQDKTHLQYLRSVHTPILQLIRLGLQLADSQSQATLKLEKQAKTNKVGFWRVVESKILNNEKAITRKKWKVLLTGFQGLKLTLYSPEFDSVLPFYYSQLKAVKDRKSGFQKLNQVLRDHAQGRMLQLVVHSSQTYKSQFNIIGNIASQGGDLAQLFLKKGVARLSLQAPRYLTIKEINHYENIIKNQKRSINKEFFQFGPEKLVARPPETLATAISALAVRPKEYNKQTTRSLRAAVDAFIRVYSKCPDNSQLQQFYAHCSKVYTRTCEELQIAPDSIQRVRLMECAGRGLVFFFSQVKEERILKRLQLSNDIEQLVKGGLKFLFLGNKVFHSKVFSLHKDLRMQFMQQMSASEQSSASQLSETEDQSEGSALSQSQNKLRYCVATMLLLLAKQFPANLERCWQPLFKLSTYRLDLISTLLATPLGYSQRIVFSSELTRTLVTQFNEPSLFSALLFQPIKRIKMLLLGLCSCFLASKQQRSLLTGVDGQFQDKIIAKYQKKMAFQSKSQIAFLTFKQLLLAAILGFKLEPDQQMQAQFLGLLSHFLQQTQVLAKIKSGPSLMLKLVSQNLIQPSAKPQLFRAVHDLLMAVLDGHPLAEKEVLLKVFQFYFEFGLKNSQPSVDFLILQFLSKCQLNYAQLIMANFGNQFELLFKRQYQLVKQDGSRMIPFLQVLLSCCQAQVGETVLLKDWYLPILKQNQNSDSLDIRTMVATILGNLKLWEGQLGHQLFQLTLAFVHNNNELAQPRRPDEIASNPRFKAMFLNLLGKLIQIKVFQQKSMAQLILASILGNIKASLKKLNVLCKLSWALANWLQVKAGSLRPDQVQDIGRHLVQFSKQPNQRVLTNSLRGLSILHRQHLCARKDQLQSVLSQSFASKLPKVRWNSFILLSAVVNKQGFEPSQDLLQEGVKAAGILNFKVQIKFAQAYLSLLSKTLLSKPTVDICFQRCRDIIYQLSQAQHSFFQIKFASELRLKIVALLAALIDEVPLTTLSKFIGKENFLFCFVEAVGTQLRAYASKPEGYSEPSDQIDKVFGLNKVKDPADHDQFALKAGNEIRLEGQLSQQFQAFLRHVSKLSAVFGSVLEEQDELCASCMVADSLKNFAQVRIEEGRVMGSLAVP